MKIYTKTGDKGETGLFDGTRVPKSDARVDAYGDVDELNALLGLARSLLREQELADILAEVQRDLFAVGAQLADPKHGERPHLREKARLTEGRIQKLEEQIDRWEAELEPLRQFILPGGVEAGAVLHYARTVCRRAERRIVRLGGTIPVSPILLAYVNRLSDFLFVMARVVNHRAGVPEIPW